MAAKPRTSPQTTAPHVVIVGAGFAGLYAARTLRYAPAQVTLIDRRNHHLFQPLLYQVAMAALTASDIAAPIRRIFRKQRNVTVLLAEAKSIDTANRRVLLEDGEVNYDYLIVGTGSTHHYFGHDEWSRWAPGLKSVDDALEVRRRMLLAFEAAERETDPEKRRAWLTFVIVGAGPTGVELAGALREIAKRTLARDFRNFDPRETRVVLIDAVDRVLPPFPPELSARAREFLERLGVQVLTGRRVTGVDADGVTIGSERIAARTILWAAGVQASALAKSLGAALDGQGRVLVRPDLSVNGHRELFVVGDLAAIPNGGGWVPGMAPAAIQEGRHAARNVDRAIRDLPSLPFRYKDRGMLATIGRSAAVVAIGRYRSAGRIAWILWLIVHIFWLIGFRNRLVVLFEWTLAYFTHHRSARIILEQPIGEEATEAPLSHAPLAAPKGPPPEPQARDRSQP